MTSPKQGAPREWWITEGEYCRNFASEDFLDDDANEMRPAKETVYNDPFYPIVSKNEFKNGIHVIEHSAYAEAVREECGQLQGNVIDLEEKLAAANAALDECERALEGVERFVRVSGEVSNNIVYENAALEHANECKAALNKLKSRKG